MYFVFLLHPYVISLLTTYSNYVGGFFFKCFLVSYNDYADFIKYEILLKRELSKLYGNSTNNLQMWNVFLIL